NLNALALSPDGDACVVSAGLDAYVIDSTGSVLHHAPLASSTPAVAISEYGERVAVGGMGALDVWKRRGAGYAAEFQVAAAASELATRVQLSRDGRTLAIGWWDFV